MITILLLAVLKVVLDYVHNVHFYCLLWLWG